MRDLLRLRKTFGIRRGAVVVGEESLAATADAVVDDLLPLLRQINASVLRVDGARVVDICAQVASSAHWIISTNPSVQQLVSESLGVLVPRVGDDAEVVTKKTLSDTGMRPEWVPAVLALSEGKDAPLKRRQAVRLLEIYETFLDRPFKELVEHACCDADMALRLYAVLTKELRKRCAEQHFLDGPMRVEKLLIERERDGVRIDMGRMKAVGRTAKASVEALRAVAIAAAGCDFDVDSSKGTTEALRKLGIWEKTSRPLGESQMEQIAGDFPLVASIVKYRRERRRHKDIEAICDAAKKGRVYPSFSQCKSAHGSLSSASPSLDEAMAVGAVLDKAIAGLFANEATSIELLIEASGDTVLRKDLRTRKGKEGFIPGCSLLGEAEQRKALLMTAVGEPEPVVSRRFLMGRADTAKLRSAITSRYEALFSWLQDFRRTALANGFAEYRGSRKYLAGLRSSDVDKRNRAVRSVVRWLARY